MSLNIKVRSLTTWLFSLSPVEKIVEDPVQKLLNGMRVTSKCRYNASIRLKRQSQFSFFATTLLSLGLILVPLLQNSDIRLAFSSKVLNMLQIFLAVAVLVYSVINATARYEIRAEALNECGDKIKDLIRNLRREVSEGKKAGTPIDLAKYNQRYDEVSTDAENHSRVDFLFASLEMKGDYCYTGLLRIFMYIRSAFLYVIPYVVPSLMLGAEVVFIGDMLGITDFFAPYLQPLSIEK
ncbi:SLATT domain-containing protein [Herbaspirillum lusitanum]|uniref:SLATT domain-containing protein n=1 Tax=Herbaspirillum lusitanum TaxID=213312 RepID=UPI00058FB6CF|nr:SLATT domain-containing protein [Herbaspirillum lusitanum]